MFKDRSVVGVVIILFALTTCVVLLLTAAALAIIVVFRIDLPEAQTGAATSFLRHSVDLILAGLLGLLAGSSRSEKSSEQQPPPALPPSV